MKNSFELEKEDLLKESIENVLPVSEDEISSKVKKLEELMSKLKKPSTLGKDFKVFSRRDIIRHRDRQKEKIMDEMLRKDSSSVNLEAIESRINSHRIN